MIVHYTDESQVGTLPIQGWEWNFGDTETSTEQNPVHVYNEPGTYTVSLTVTTQDGADIWTETAYIHVSVGMPAFGYEGVALLVGLLFLGGFVVIRRTS